MANTPTHISHEHQALIDLATERRLRHCVIEMIATLHTPPHSVQGAIANGLAIYGDALVREIALLIEQDPYCLGNDAIELLLLIANPAAKSALRSLAHDPHTPASLREGASRGLAIQGEMVRPHDSSPLRHYDALPTRPSELPV